MSPKRKPAVATNRDRSLILTGDALTVLKTMAAGSYDAAFCDPPYHLTAGKRGGSGIASENLKHPGGRSRATTGFMGKVWDGGDVAFRPELWAEVLRVLKPGSPMLVFGGTRTFHRLVCAIEDAGFLVADTICWLHGQGFPKGKAQLKPAWEPITLAWKKGARQPLAIDECRIELNGEKQPTGSGDRSGDKYAQDDWTKTHQHGGNKTPPLGRWPANLILDEETGELLDAQSGHLISGNNPAKRSADKHRNVYRGWKGEQCLVHRGTDSGGASRFFYCAKASRKERGEGNTHPTVKPLKLCEYLARLILPQNPDAKLLVPFSGSGSEMIGARRAGWKHITGIEREIEYVAMAERRMELQSSPACSPKKLTAAC